MKTTPMNQGEQVQFETGAVRNAKVAGDNASFPLRFDLLMSNISFMSRIAATFGEGAQKYGDDNWREGFPEKTLVNHAMAHLIQHLSGDRSEDHLAHLVWGFMTLMWMQDNKPELLDLCKLANKNLRKPDLTPEGQGAVNLAGKNPSTEFPSVREISHMLRRLTALESCGDVTLDEAKYLAKVRNGELIYNWMTVDGVQYIAEKYLVE